MTLRVIVSKAYRRMPRPTQQALASARAAVGHYASLIRRVDLAAGLLRRQLRPGQLFVGWILSADEDDGFTRVCGVLPHTWLRRLDTNSVILRKSRPWGTPLQLRPGDIPRVVRARFDVIVFHGVQGAGAEALATALRAAGTKTIFAAGDLVRGSMIDVVDQVVVPSEALRAVARGRESAAEVIEPVIDAPPGVVKDYSRQPPRDDIRVVWVGYPGNLRLLEPVRQALRSPRLARYRLVTISRGPGVTHQWHRKRVHRQLIDCDIAVLPSAASEWYMAKPNTRMTMLKSLGLPIVASPTPAYTSTLRHGESCYFARDVDDWIEALEKLGSFEARAAIGLAARERIVSTFGVDAVTRRWHACFERLARTRPPLGSMSERPEPTRGLSGAAE